MQRIHTSDQIRRLVFRDLRNGASIEELHQKYGINKKTLQSLKEERQDVGRPLKQYLIRKVLYRLPSENNLKKLLRFCRKQIREMISTPDKEFKLLLNDYNSRKKIKLVRSNRKIIDGIANLIVQTAIGVNQYSPRDSINNHFDDQDSDHQLITSNQESSVSTLHHSIDDAYYQQNIDNMYYQQNEESALTVLIQGKKIDHETINYFINQVLFEDSLSQQSTQLLNISQDLLVNNNDVQRNIQQSGDHQGSEYSTVESQSQAVRRLRRNQQI